VKKDQVPAQAALARGLGKGIGSWPRGVLAGQELPWSPHLCSGWALTLGNAGSKPRNLSGAQSLTRCRITDTSDHRFVPQSWGTIGHSLGSVMLRAWRVRTRNPPSQFSWGLEVRIVVPSRQEKAQQQQTTPGGRRHAIAVVSRDGCNFVGP
jgi:hypothetical protein